MIVDDRIRDLVDAEVSTIHLPALDGVANIGQVAAKRKRRRTGLGGLATLVMMFGLIAVIGPRFGEPTTDVFAGTSNPDAVPSKVLALDDGTYLGLAVVDLFDPDELGNISTVLVTSTDGRDWNPVGEALAVGNSGVELTWRDGVVHLVTVRQVAEAASSGEGETISQLVHATSTNLVTWEEQTYDNPASLDRPGQSFLVGEVVATNSGVVVLLEGRPTRLAFESFLLDNYDALCGLSADSSGSSYRLCGEEDFVKIPLNQTLSTSRIDTVVVMIDDEGVREVKPPSWGTSGPTGPNSVTLFETSDGFGLSGYQVHETANGDDWDYVSVGSDRNVLVAGRGDERVLTTQSSSFMLTEDGHEEIPGSFGMAFSDDAGETWEQIDISQIFDADAMQDRAFNYIDVGPAGWVMSSITWSEGRPTAAGVEVDEDRFTATSKGYVLEGVLPFGTAELRDPSGTVVRSWDHFEVANPNWSGLEIIGGDISVTDPLTGDELALFSMEQWRAMLPGPQPATLPAPPLTRTEILFSPDGRNWTLIDAGPAFAEVLAIGDDELIVQRYVSGLWSQLVPPIEMIPLGPDS